MLKPQIIQSPGYDTESETGYTAKIIFLVHRLPKNQRIRLHVTAFVEKDDLDVLTLTKEKLADEKREGSDFLKRDAANLINAGVAILLGIKTSSAAILDCLACGFETYVEMLNRQKVEAEFKGPN